MKLIPGEGLKPTFVTSRAHSSASTPNEANPWRGIETIDAENEGWLDTPAPNEANPWRGIETLCKAYYPIQNPFAPNEANPWRGIETHHNRVT